MSDETDKRIADLEQQVADLRARLARVTSASEERIRGIADALPVMISYIDAGERLRFANRAYEQWLERPLDGIVDRLAAEVLSPADYAERRPYIERALAGERLAYEVTLGHSQGLRHAQVHHIPHVEDGAVRGFYTLVQDVTEQRRAIEALRESEARFRRIADSAPVPIWVTAADRTRAFVNVAYAEFTGLANEEARLFDWRTVLHPDDQARILAESRAGEASGRRFALEARYRRTDGEWRWLRSISQPRFDAEGAPEGFIGVAEDITEAKQATEIAQHHAQVLAARADRRTRERDRLWEISQEAIMICDRQGIWRSASPAWTRMLGWPVEELVGSTVRRLVHPDDRDASHQAWMQLTRGETVRELTNRLLGADGRYRWLAWNAVPEGDDVYCTARDVTDAREQAQALREAEDALRQAQKVEALGQLTGGVAHDFNNLLTPILGTLDLLARRPDQDARAARLLDGALQSATRAKTLVQRLLAFARRQPLRIEPVDVGALVRGLDQLLRSTFGPTIEISLHIEDGVPAALADPHQVEMALLNLAVNARDAMPGGGRLDIGVRATTIDEVWEEARPGRYICLSVRDSGMGMDETTRRRAIEPFFSTKGPGGGTGLGLSMVHGLAGQLGGALRITSAPGEGTVVELLLPCTSAAVSAAAPDAGEDAAPGPLKILLVDDEPMVRSSTAAMLAELRHEVTACASGSEALRTVGNGYVPDILVTDQIMPAMSGTELITAMRRLHPDLPTLLISGFRGMTAHPSSAPFLAKPFTIKQIARALQDARAQG